MTKKVMALIGVVTTLIVMLLPISASAGYPNGIQGPYGMTSSSVLDNTKFTADSLFQSIIYKTDFDQIDLDFIDAIAQYNNVPGVTIPEPKLDYLINLDKQTGFIEVFYFKFPVQLQIDGSSAYNWKDWRYSIVDNTIIPWRDTPTHENEFSQVFRFRKYMFRTSKKLIAGIEKHVLEFVHTEDCYYASNLATYSSYVLYQNQGFTRYTDGLPYYHPNDTTRYISDLHIASKPSEIGSTETVVWYNGYPDSRNIRANIDIYYDLPNKLSYKENENYNLIYTFLFNQIISPVSAEQKSREMISIEFRDLMGYTEEELLQNRLIIEKVNSNPLLYLAIHTWSDVFGTFPEPIATFGEALERVALGENVNMVIADLTGQEIEFDFDIGGVVGTITSLFEDVANFTRGFFQALAVPFSIFPLQMYSLLILSFGILIILRVVGR